jgi:voltage-gated potassium channel
VENEQAAALSLERRLTRYQNFEKASSPTMTALSILFIPVFLLSLWPAIPRQQLAMLEAASWAIWAAFAAEFAVRLALAPNRGKMLRSSVFDLIIILVPCLRIARAGKAVRALRAIGRSAIALGGATTMAHALMKVRSRARRRGDLYVVGLVAVATIAGAVTILNVELGAPDPNIRTFGDAVWWAVSTVTTVGYGDRYPTTSEGRLIAFVLMVLGLGLFSAVTARIATFFIVDDATDSVSARLDRIELLLLQQKPQASDAPQDDTGPPK